MIYKKVLRSLGFIIDDDMIEYKGELTSYYETIKATLEALLEPSKEMLDAGSDAWSGYDPEYIFKAMIKEAIGDADDS